LRRFRIKRCPCLVREAINDVPPHFGQLSLRPRYLFDLHIFIVTDVHRDRYYRTCPHDTARRHLDVFAGGYIGAFVNCNHQVIEIFGCKKSDSRFLIRRTR